MAETGPGSLAVLTSGGDAPGMNAAVRAVVRSGLHHGLEVHAVHEGFRGLVAGGEAIAPMTWSDVGGIMQRGGTVIGSARCPEFRDRDGRRRAVRNLLAAGIDALVVIGGDGSLTGAGVLHREWSDLVEELAADGVIPPEQADHPRPIRVVGLVGSIDNDVFGTDMTIGADTALHRITDAVDALTSTAASHQRTFVIEVMGRRCGYLALMGALATGANWALIPERPPDVDDWRSAMCSALAAGRAAGRRQNLVILAEGARTRAGDPITAEEVKAALEERLGEETRITKLGHVQRGGSPSAFDRTMSTQLGHAAVQRLVAGGDPAPQLIGLREHEVVSAPLLECVEETHEVAAAMDGGDFDRALSLRGGSFEESFATLRHIVRARPRAAGDGSSHRLLLLHAGGPAPGMNTAVRAATRLALDGGHTVLAARRGFAGVATGRIEELGWMDVSGWVSAGGAELGTHRGVPGEEELRRIEEELRAQGVDGVLMIGGHEGYATARALDERVGDDRDGAVPIVCLPASISNDLPGSELSVGADTALNAIIEDVDKIKRSAVASQRVFVVEVMGADCGYLALMGGLATGAERVYIPEEGVSLDDLRRTVEALTEGFRGGKRLGLVIRGERADAVYTTGFIRALFDKEGGEVFDVREAILGHVQQGGDPSPFDRIQATRLTARCVEYLVEQAGSTSPRSAVIGLERGRMRFTDLNRIPSLMASEARRPAEQWWLRLRPVARTMARRPG